MPSFTLLILILIPLSLASLDSDSLARLDIPTDLRRIYQACDAVGNASSVVSCVGIGRLRPAGGNCLRKYDCLDVVTYEPRGNNFSFTISSTLPAKQKNRYYFAVGFALKPLMDNALVVACIHIGSQNSIGLFRNTNNRANKPGGGNAVTAGKITYDGKYLTCSFSIQNFVRIQGFDFALDTTPYHVIAARGVPKAQNQLQYHGSPNSFLDPNAVMLKERHVRDITQGKAAQLSPLRIHAIAMLIAYVFLIPISMMTARFFKESCNNWKICERRPWFTIHLLGTIAAVMIIWLSNFFYYTQFGSYRIKTERATFHYYFGLATMIVTSIAGSLGVMLIWVNPSYVVVRQILGLVHWLMATSSYVMGLTSIALSPFSMPYYLKFCSYIELVMVLWIIIHGAFYAFLTLSMYARDRLDELVYQSIMAKLGKLQQARLRTKTQMIRKSFAPAMLEGTLPGAHSAENFAVTTDHFEKASKIMGHINYNKIIVSKFSQPSVQTRRGSIGNYNKFGGWRRGSKTKPEEDHLHQHPHYRTIGHGSLDKPIDMKIINKLQVGEKTGGDEEQARARGEKKIDFLAVPRGTDQDLKQVSFRGSELSLVGSDGTDDENDAFRIPADEFDEQIAFNLLKNFEDKHTGELKKSYRTFIQYPLRPTDRENPDTFKIMIVLGLFASLCFANFCLLVFFFNLELEHRGCQRGPENKFTFSEQFFQVWDVSTY